MRTRPFVDQTCPKCGCIDADMKYQRTNLDSGKTEALLCKCNRCGYRWEMEPLDAEVTAKPSEHTES